MAATGEVRATIVRRKPSSMAMASTARAIKTGKRTGPGNTYRAQIEALLGEADGERVAEAWQRVCPFAIASECELPDRQGIIQDLADFAEVLRPNLEDMTANWLCRRVETYGSVANSEKSRPSMRPMVLRVELPASSSRRTSTSRRSPATARTPRSVGHRD